jgi:hypothetical protein
MTKNPNTCTVCGGTKMVEHTGLLGNHPIVCWNCDGRGTEHPVVRYKNTRHAVYAGGGPGDGSLWGMYTLCGMIVHDNQCDPNWQEVSEDVTCGNCLRSLAAAKGVRNG